MSTILQVQGMQKYYGSRGVVTKPWTTSAFPWRKANMSASWAFPEAEDDALNCISTIDTVTAGTIRIKGKDVTALKGKELERFRREELGFIFQDFNLLDTLTAYENIALALTILGEKPDEIHRRVLEVATKLNISGILSKFPYQMSGGESNALPAPGRLLRIRR